MTKIIVIEDEVVLGKIYRDNLIRAGYESMTADSIEAAVKLAESFQADLFLLDQGLDVGKDGVEGLDDLKKCFPKAIFIVLSNYTKRDIEEKAAIVDAANANEQYTENVKSVSAFWDKLTHGSSLVPKLKEFLKEKGIKN